jgi:hypothetical protein
MTRCYKTNIKAFFRYWGEGVYVCEFLRRSPQSLLSLIGERPPKTSIDRIDNEGNYTCGKCRECIKKRAPMNVRWATRLVQNRNRRRYKKR